MNDESTKQFHPIGVEKRICSMSSKHYIAPGHEMWVIYLERDSYERKACLYWAKRVLLLEVDQETGFISPFTSRYRENPNDEQPIDLVSGTKTDVAAIIERKYESMRGHLAIDGCDTDCVIAKDTDADRVDHIEFEVVHSEDCDHETDENARRVRSAA